MTSPTATSTEYVIISVESYYGPIERRSLVASDLGARAVRFASRAAARQHIDEYLTAGPLELRHNQYGQDYRIERVDRLPQYLKDEV